MQSLHRASTDSLTDIYVKFVWSMYSDSFLYIIQLMLHLLLELLQVSVKSPLVKFSLDIYFQ